MTRAAERNTAVLQLLREGAWPQAALACRELTQQHPHYAPGWALAARIALQMAQPAAALELVGRAVALEPQEARYLLLSAVALRATDRPADADHAAALASGRCGEDPIAWDELGSYHVAAAAFPEALRCYTRAVELEPKNARWHFNRATVLRIVGDLAEAECAYDRVLALKPDEYEAWYNRSDLRRQTPERNHVAALEALLEAGIAHPRGEVFVRYALARELEDIGEYARAFGHLRRGASLRRRHITYAVEQDLDTVGWIEAALPAELLARPSTGHPSRAPIFIVGMPRTGTTLLERCLGQHPEILAAGELPHFANALTAAALAHRKAARLSRQDLIATAPQLDLRALGEDYLSRCRPQAHTRAHFIDKLPLNYLYCGLIHRALPAARIIHLTRHPLASCHAMYKTLFKDAYPFSYDFDDLARYYAGYRSLMRHWHAAMPGVILDVSYEGLVGDLKSELRRVLAYCGLEWHDACLEFHRNPNPSATASASQVRQPLYASSLHLWEHYATELKPLYERLRANGIAEAELNGSAAAARTAPSL